MGKKNESSPKSAFIKREEEAFEGLNMASKKDSGASSILLTPLLGLKSRKSDKDTSSAIHASLPSVTYLPSRSSKNLVGLERESVENATVSLHQVTLTIFYQVVVGLPPLMFDF